MIYRILQIIVWLPILFFSGLLIHNALLYYTFEPDYGILPEKTEAIKNPLWLPCLYIHVLTGIVCLVVPVFSFFGKHIRVSVNWHRKIGAFYVWVSVLLVAPTGTFLAIYAKGGLPAQSGFLLQGILMSAFTWWGYQAGLKYKIKDHIRWMTRSYAVAAAVLTFRIFHILFFILEIPYEDNYGIAQWLSVMGNLLLAELAILAMEIKSKNNVQLKFYKL